MLFEETDFLAANRNLSSRCLGTSPQIFRDARGFFMETYHRAEFADLGITEIFVQDNHSRSAKGTLRGLHYQLHHPQAKLCRVVEGEALDVAVDIRLGSPTFGKWTSVLLSANSQNQIFIPAGFAHGFLALTDSVQFLYKCSDFYDPCDEHGILWNDPDLAISWGVASTRLREGRGVSHAGGDAARILAALLRQMKPAILLIGANGQIGHELSAALPRVGQVTALDRQQLDLTQPAEIRRAIRDFQPALIVNAAGYTAVDRAESEAALARAVNADAPAVMAEEAQKIGAGLVHYSTDYVFDGSEFTV